MAVQCAKCSCFIKLGPLCGKCLAKARAGVQDSKPVTAPSVRGRLNRIDLSPCRYLGDYTGEAPECDGCKGKRKVVPTRHCAVFGVCTAAEGVLYQDKKMVPWCRTCEKYETVPPAGLREQTERVLSVIEGGRDGWPTGWQGWPGTIEAYRIRVGQKLEEYRSTPYPAGKFSGRGVVIGAGSAKYFACAWAAFSVLRWLGCDLPVEFWYLGRCEMDPQMRAVAQSAGVTLVDATEVAKTLSGPPRILNGWELKPFSVLHSRFEEVLYLDADCVPVKDPSFLFDHPEYQKHGSAFWPDLPPGGKPEWLPPTCWYNFGLEYRREPAFETGQFLVNKSRCWAELNLTTWVNHHSDYYYEFLFGDKDTFHLSWRRAGSDYAMPDKPAGWRSPAIQQYDFDGSLLFQHACRGKELIASGEQVPGLNHSVRCIDANRVLRQHWNGTIWDHAAETPEEQALALDVSGVYLYKRIGLGQRVLELRPDGFCGAGSAACEKRWTLRLIDGQPTLIIVGEAHKKSEIGMMFLIRGSDGVWRGRWEAYERGLVELHPHVSTEAPTGWVLRAGTWDEDIFNCVVRDNEYRLPGRLEPGSVVIDVGAHVGSFGLACLRRGADMVYCLEPEPSNFRVLSHNLGTQYPGKVQILEAALWDGNHRAVLVDDGTNNTGGFSLANEGEGLPVAWLALHDVILLASKNRSRRVRLLKLDCEGGEFPGLMYCPEGALALVDEVVGEWHEFKNYTEAQLVARLESCGFTVESKRDSEKLGHFWARRK